MDTLYHDFRVSAPKLNDVSKQNLQFQLEFFQ